MNIEVTAGRPHADSFGKSAKPSVSDVTGPEAPRATLETESSRNTALEAEVVQMRDRWMRSEAEVANVRARSRRDVDEARQFAIQKFGVDVVEMAENVQRGVASMPTRSDREPEILTRLRDGFSGIEHSFMGLLERNGIERHDPTGATFDPNLHQAMDQQVSAGHRPGTVLQAWTSAWTLNGRLLRPAMVVVSAASPNPSKSGT
jgi:molecular chaperone GrpE